MTFLELPYFIGYSLNKNYSLAGRKRLPFRTISIGNITFGGTGKTPATIAFAGELQKRGLAPVILTRGYKGRVKGPCFVRQSAGLMEGPSVSTVEEAGDEPLLMAERLADVPIVKCADRFAGAEFALRHLTPIADRPVIFILDDGFQHWKLYRDTDVVLVDGLNPFGNGKLLPLGCLREPLAALKRADFIIMTRIWNEESAKALKGIAPDTPVFFSGLSADILRNSIGEIFPLEFLKDKTVMAFCGIGNPEAFRRTLMPLCRDLAGFTHFRDHYRYTRRDLEELASVSERLGSDFMVTTEKDMIKLKGLYPPNRLLSLAISFTPDKAVFDAIIGHSKSFINTQQRPTNP